jgi:FO synthase
LRAGASGCHEALFTLGDKPELRYRLHECATGIGARTALSYLTDRRARVRGNRLLPHINAGVMSRDELSRLREVLFHKA